MILPEIVEIGFYDSNIVDKNFRISKNRKTTMFEIELPLEEGGTSYVDTESKAISPNMIICAKPDQVRHTKFPFKCYFIHSGFYLCGGCGFFGGFLSICFAYGSGCSVNCRCHSVFCS